MDQNQTLSNMVLESGTPGPESTSQAIREEQGRISNSSDNYDAGRTKPSGSRSADAAPCERNCLRFTKTHNIGTWNVRGMNTGKLDIVKIEMKRLKIDILGISELHWAGSGYFNSDDYTVYYSGNESIRRNGVAFIANKKIATAVQGFSTINDRIISIHIDGKPRQLTILQVYAPTTDAKQEDIEKFYADLQQAIDQTPAKNTIYITGDFNAKVGAGEDAPVVGKFGLGKRNEAGDRLIQCCQENRLLIANTWFEQPKRRLYTWTAPNGQHRNQIDYFLCQQRWRSSIQAVKALPGADCGSDHQLLIAKVKLRFNTTKRPPVMRRLDTSNIPARYVVEVKNKIESLNAIGKASEELWEEMKSIITDTAEQSIPYKKSAKRPQWLSDATIEIANRRRAVKATGKGVEFRVLKAEFQREARRDKEHYWNERCLKLEEACKQGHTRELFAHVKQARAPFAPRKAANIKDRNGKILQNGNQIKCRWQEYTAELYAGNRPSHSAGLEDPTKQEPDIMEEEVARALKQLPNRKAPGIDGIPAELLKPIPIQALTELCQQIWKTKTWPKDWTRSVFVPIPKKGDTHECCNYRTVALISHASKILLKIIQQRMASFVNKELLDVQEGFRRGRGTRDQISNLRCIMEKTREYQKDVYVCFIDYSKAFDCIDHDKLWNCLKQMGIPEHLQELIRSLYENQDATVRTAFGNTNWFKISKGIRQGCILSPALFNLYAETIMRRCNLDESLIGVKIGGRNINNLRYADDTTLLAESEQELEYLIRRVKEESERMGLHLNIKKTKIMTTADNGTAHIIIDNERIELVLDFLFLGFKIDRSGESGPEIKRRIALGRSAMQGMAKIWKSKDISTATKFRMVNAIVFPISTYACESWTLKKVDRRKIDAFELWCWRRMLRTPWTLMATNKTILEQVKPKTSLEGLITKQRLSYFGHTMRANSLETTLMLGMVSGRRIRGRQRTRWMDTIKSDTNMSVKELKETAKDRKAWRMMIHKMTKSRRRLNG